MKSFNELMELTRTVNCEGVYSDLALSGLYGAAVSSPNVGNFVEIGCEYGRSTSLIAQIAKERHQYLVCIDPFVRHLSGEPGENVGSHTFGMLCKIDLNFAFLRGKSYEVPYEFGPIAFLHIDGNHSRPFIWSDFQRYAHLVVDGGHVAFHDYGDPGPYCVDVKQYVDEILAIHPERWTSVGLYDTCMVIKKRGAYENYYSPEGGRP